MSIVIIPNPLKPAERTVTRIKQATRVRDLVPQAKQVRVVINGEEGTLDSVVTPNDVVAIVVVPGDPITAAIAAFSKLALWQQIVIKLAIGFILGQIANAIYKPKKPSSQSGSSPSPTYSIGAANNQARLGEVLPVIYGDVPRYTPDYAAQPYTEFVGEDQWLCALFSLGVGDVRVNDIYVGNTLLTEAHEHTLRVYTPAQHGQVLGTIQHDWWTNKPTGVPATHAPFIENMWSSEDIGELQLSAANEPDQTGTAVGTYYRTLGPYTVGKSGYNYPIAGVSIDIQFPRGLYRQDDRGAFHEHSVKIHVDWDRIDDNNTVTQTGSQDLEFKGAHDRARRYTILLDAPAAGWAAATGSRIRVRAYRITDSKLDRYHSDQVMWTGLKVRFDPPAAPKAYGNVTLAALRLKASDAFSSSSSQQISMSVTRMSGGAALSNPADVYTDIITNPVLIASPVPALQMDSTAINAARLKWQGAVAFNGVFDQASTAWEASQIALQVAGSAPMRAGQKMTLVHDCVKDARVALFGRGNIVEASLKISYVFAQADDPDGVKVEYRDSYNFDPRFVTVDLTGKEDPNLVNTENITLFGCTDRTLASQHARLRANRRTISRKSVTFETELEGLIVLHGDRIAVSHDMPSWGQSGAFVSYDAATRTAVVDAPLDWSGTGHMILARDAFGVVHSTTVTQGADESTMVLGTAINLHGFGDLEPTVFAFGTSTTAVTDWIVTSMTPNGTTVTIEAVAYDPAVYTGTMPWQAYATTDAGPPPVVVTPPALPAIPAMPVVPPRQTPPTGPGATPPAGTTFRVPTTGELLVLGQFSWDEAPRAFNLRFGGRSYEVWSAPVSTWTAPDGVIYHKGSGSNPYAVWAEWPSSAGPIPILPGEPGYIPPDIPPPDIPQGA